MGGEVKSNPAREFGRAHCTVLPAGRTPHPGPQSDETTALRTADAYRPCSVAGEREKAGTLTPALTQREREKEDGLFAGVPEQTEVWMSHGDQVTSVSADFEPLAQDGDLPDYGGET